MVVVAVVFLDEYAVQQTRTVWALIQYKDVVLLGLEIQLWR